MPTYLQNLIARRDAIAAELAAGQTPDGQSFRHPSVQIDGETVATDAYVERLYHELAHIEQRIVAAQGPFEAPSGAVT
jgi:hypothetical protein